MDDDDAIVGGEPLVDGMHISLRYRRDFHVADAARLLAAARAAYRELHPGSTSSAAEERVTCAAEAIFTILEHAGLLGDKVDDRLDAQAAEGLELGGWRAQIVLDEPWPLHREPRRDCLRPADVFALRESAPTSSPADPKPRQ
ncbi:hypothetical protein [Nocardia tenerifensis]|uniref:hypothetical protein n=1 Tax=Nocardia tenerifensis TaxID=228006 RepID=UPI0011B6E733|nr:hypothetical protein [Nocardia tenerifensis]